RQQHSTMLLHSSLSVSVHEGFRRPIAQLQQQLRETLAEPSVLESLREQWDEETERVLAGDHGVEPVEFARVLKELPTVLTECRVVLDNSHSTERLNYRKGPVLAIAVGGNTLSRGLTLEGLVVSYFVRSVSTYDTLLQMGRWFGFRGGYGDLPRIWMTKELRNWFRHIATVEAELRQDIERYVREPDLTPRQFAVRIRTHPSLRVTSAAKMADAVRAASSYGGQRIQTRYFRADDEDWLVANQNAAKNLIAAVASTTPVKRLNDGGGRLLFERVSASLVLEFLREYKFHELSFESDPGLMAGYIKKRIAGDVLREWNVAVLGNDPTDDSTDPGDLFDFGSGICVSKVTRSKLEGTGPSDADIKTLMSRRDAAVDLDDVPTSTLTESQIKTLRANAAPDVGLLTIYPIDALSVPMQKSGSAKNPTRKREPLGAEADVIGVGLVFPLPVTGDDAQVEWNYVSADLRWLSAPDGYIEEEDASLLDEDFG
ncbi:endonuclease, partial [bacterium]